MRAQWGCHGGGLVTHFAGTEHETSTCPRRHLLRNPDVVPLFALRRSCDGQVGIEGSRKLTPAALEGLAVIDDAVAWRMEDDAKQRARDAVPRG